MCFQWSISFSCSLRLLNLLASSWSSATKWSLGREGEDKSERFELRAKSTPGSKSQPLHGTGECVREVNPLPLLSSVLCTVCFKPDRHFSICVCVCAGTRSNTVSPAKPVSFNHTTRVTAQSTTKVKPGRVNHLLNTVTHVLTGTRQYLCPDERHI